MPVINFKEMTDNEISDVINQLLETHPGVVGIIQQMINDKSKKVSDLSQKVKEKLDNKTLMPRDVELLIKELSQQYSVLLGQISDVENQLMQAEELKDDVMRAKNTVRIMTLPIALLMEFNRVLKECRWAKIRWDEKKDTKCNNISDYARLVDVYVEPNSTWEGLVNFTFVLGGYITESAYEELKQVSAVARAPYYQN
jgi:hypothetical protein